VDWFARHFPFRFRFHDEARRIAGDLCKVCLRILERREMLAQATKMIEEFIVVIGRQVSATVYSSVAA
jgi:hypothetical protein